jgi:hypothetical protein
MTDIVVNREKLFKALNESIEGHKQCIDMKAPHSASYWEGRFDLINEILGLPLDELTNRLCIIHNRDWLIK